MLLETGRELKKGERFAGTFTVGHREIVAECIIVRVSRSAGRFACGVKFRGLDTQALIIIEQFVKSQMKR